MKIGFLGAGNMASAILGGMVTSKAFLGKDLFVFDRHPEKMEDLEARYGVQNTESMEALAETVDVLVLSIKPKGFAAILPQLAPIVKEKGSFIISIAAGKTLAFLEEGLGFSAPLARVMPNINATVSESMTAYCCNDNVQKEQKQLLKTMCESFGKAVELSEAQFPLFGVIAGSAPAFSYLYMDALARAAVKHGMPKAQALEIAAQMTLGSAKQILESDKHPMELVDKVCSPGGTTIEGVESLQADGFEAAVHRAVDVTLEKDSKI